MHKQKNIPQQKELTISRVVAVLFMGFLNFFDDSIVQWYYKASGILAVLIQGLPPDPVWL